jgi:hypothetical protein
MNFQFKVAFYPLCMGMGGYSFSSVLRDPPLLTDKFL